MTDPLNKIENWFKAEALPFWAKAAIDKAGGVYEFLNMSGIPINNVNRRVRVQARYAYTYAHASKLDWIKNGKEISDHAWNYLLGPGSAGDEDLPGSGYKGCAHLLNPDGSLFDGMRDTYAQAFVILAGAWRFMAFGDEHALDISKQTLGFLDVHLKALNGGWHEGIPATLPRRQNPHMHMFEALMSLYDATNDPEILERVDDLFHLFETVFFEPQTGVLLEFFDNNWNPVGDGGPLEPGHMMEWVWLLREYETRTGHNVDHYSDVLFASAIRLGFNDQASLLYDGVNIDESVETESFRLWPQLEMIKAAIAQTKAGRPEAEKYISSTIRVLFDTYLDVGIDGGWADQLDGNTSIVSNNMPTSTAYHIMCAVAEICKFRSL